MGQQVPSKAAMGQVHGSDDIDGFDAVESKSKGQYMRVQPTTHRLPLATTKHSTTNSTICYKKGSQG
jgi:hypothetical protein